MRDEEYCEVMIEAYRDILGHILEGNDLNVIVKYITEQIKFHDKWADEAGSRGNSPSV